MIAVLQKGSYIIESILSEKDDMVIYTARNKDHKKFIISEVRDIEIINRFLPQLNELMKKGVLTCTAENSCLYIITHYYEGENAAIYFKTESPSIAQKLEMIKQAAFKMIEYSNYPDIIGRSLLQPESLCVCRGEICMNFYFAPYEERNIFYLFYLETEKMFTKDEIRRFSYIGIVLQKLKNGIYSDFMQVYLDIEQLIPKCAGKGKALISGIKAFYEKIQAPLKIIATAATLILAAIVLYNSFIKNSKESTESAFNPIDHIGTVSIDNENNKEFKDIHVGNAENE